MESQKSDTAPLVSHLRDVLQDLHRHPYPYVPNPPRCKRRAAVALIIRVRPHHQHQAQSLAVFDKSSSIPEQLDTFFSQEWVQRGDPEVLFIKRASRVGDRWTGHVALPGGKRDPEDVEDKATAIRETREEIGLDLDKEEAIYVGNLPERVVTSTWGSVPLMVLCPYIWVLTSHKTPTLNLQPTEVASAHWISLRVLLSSSLRTVEYADVSDRFVKPAGMIGRLAVRWTIGMMEFSAIRLIPTESLYCSSAPGFVPQSESQTLFQRWESWLLSNQAGSGDLRRSLLLWGLTLGIMTDFLDMLPPRNAVKLWKHPTFTVPDLRLIVMLMTYNIRKRNEQRLVRHQRRPSDTAADNSTVAVPVTEGASQEHELNAVGIGGLGVGRFYGTPSTGHHADGLLLKAYYDRLRQAIGVFLAWRVAAGAVGSYYLWRWLRS